MTKKILIVMRGGNLKEHNINIKENELYKKCNFKTGNNFERRHTWKHNDKYVSLYSRDTGRANTENKYELPPPIDKELYYGKMLLIMHNNKTYKDEEVENLSKDEWVNIYNTLIVSNELIKHT